MLQKKREPERGWTCFSLTLGQPSDDQVLTAYPVTYLFLVGIVFLLAEAEGQGGKAIPSFIPSSSIHPAEGSRVHNQVHVLDTSQSLMSCQFVLFRIWLKPVSETQMKYNCYGSSIPPGSVILFDYSSPPSNKMELRHKALGLNFKKLKLTCSSISRSQEEF